MLVIISHYGFKNANRKLYIIQSSWIIVFREFIRVFTVKPSVCWSLELNYINIWTVILSWMFSFVQDFKWEMLRIRMAKKSARKLVFFYNKHKYWSKPSMLQHLQLKLNFMLHIDPISGKRSDITERNEKRQTHIPRRRSVWLQQWHRHHKISSKHWSRRLSSFTGNPRRTEKAKRESTCLADMRKRGDSKRRGMRKCLYKGAGKYGYEHCVCNRDMWCMSRMTS